MRNPTTRLATGFGGMIYALLLASAQAEDIEIFVGNADPSLVARPNILLILDNSGSMGPDSGEIQTQTNYDPAQTYPGNCLSSRVYWSTTAEAPDCSSEKYFNLSALKCQRAIDSFNAPMGGRYYDNFAQYDPGFQDRWETISESSKNSIVECEDDLPDTDIGWAGHGETTGSADVYPRNADDTQPWTDDPEDPARIVWGANPAHLRYQIYSGNYLNWYHGSATSATRLEVMQDVAINFLNSLNGVNVGLMYFDGDEGGLVAHAMEDIAAARPALTATIGNLAADGATPLQETLYEAYLYMRGGTVTYGINGVAEARRPPPNDNLYDSPIDQSCQKNHIVYLTDGWPTNDDGATSEILGLTDSEGRSFNSLVGGTCDAESYPSEIVPTPTGGQCLDDLAEFMFEGDLSLLPGQQNVTTHTVGFLVDLPYLSDTAERGGGTYSTAIDTATLSSSLNSVLTGILDTQSTFTAPSISVNAYNQARHLDDIYVSVFQPSGTLHWPGNLKKYRLRASDSTIVDANDAPVIDAESATFSDTAQDFWSDTVDGSNVAAGGAASRISNARNVYTYLGISEDLNNSSNVVSTSNSSLTDSLLNTSPTGEVTRERVIDFINGRDVTDTDQDGDTTEARRQMGDPLHSRSVVVTYGPGNDDALVFVGTNDGYLHAFNVDDGTEAWAFLPPEFLGMQAELLVDNLTGAKAYGVDGGIRVQTIGDNDGVIEEANGEKAYLFFGMRRGGDAFYALDVTDPDDPQVMWHTDSNDLPGAGQSWSSVTPTRVNISGAVQNEHKLVLVMGGGYDATQDAVSASVDASGNSIYMLDTETGDLLWHGTDTGGTQNFENGSGGSAWSMSYSIPSDIRAMDLNGDGFADRMYAADMGGQIWRFDITNGNPAASLVAGGVIAQLGAAGHAAPDDASVRRFYYAPDVAVVTTKDYNFMHVGIGSGHRAHPNSTANQDAIFALRDYSTFTPKNQATYDAFDPIVPSDLIDVTTNIDATVPQGTAGWRIDLNDGGWRGEKVLAGARTFDGNIFVSTYRPGTSAGCAPSLGTRRQYIVDLINASPVTNLDGSVDPNELELTDRYREFVGTPPPETVFFFPGPESGDTDGDGDIDAYDLEFSLACLAEGDCLGETPCQGLICFDSGGAQRTPTRTIWRQDDIE